jgi:hypothetical protein
VREALMRCTAQQGTPTVGAGPLGASPNVPRPTVTPG